MNYYILKDNKWQLTNIKPSSKNYHTIKLHDLNLNIIGIGFYKKINK